MEQSNLDSMYAAYKKEFEDINTVFIKNVGFANWKWETDGIYVQEVYVDPIARGAKYAAKLTDMCIENAQLQDRYVNVKKVYTTVAIGGKTIDASLRAITDYGFKVLKADHELIYFYKELNNE